MPNNDTGLDSTDLENQQTLDLNLVHVESQEQREIEHAEHVPPPHRDAQYVRRQSRDLREHRRSADLVHVLGLDGKTHPRELEAEYVRLECVLAAAFVISAPVERDTEHGGLSALVFCLRVVHAFYLDQKDAMTLRYFRRGLPMPMFQDHQMCRCAQHSREGFHSKSAPLHYPPDLALEPQHLDIDLSVDPDTQTAAGTVTTTVVARSAGVRAITFDAVDFDIEAVTSKDAPLVHSYDGKKLKVTWDEPFAHGESRKVAVTYRVVEPVAGLYFSKPSEEYPDRPRWAATDHETERARYWLPCIDHLNVRTTLSFHLTAAKEFVILANGAAQETVPSGDQKTAHWVLDFPCPSYIVCFALGEFTEMTDGEFEGIPVAYYAAKHWTPAHLERSFGRTTEMLAWMTKRLDRPFPFPKYFQFALPGIGGAMENISLVSWDDIFVLDEDLAREWTWLVDQINVHEMAHSYFGDAVVCRDFAHVWLKESWATYMEQCWLEDRYGVDEMQYDFYRNSAAYLSEADDSYKRPMVTRTFDSSWDMYDRHLYPGGATRLHTLRNELGDEAFWSGVSNYLAENTRSVVETEDFRRAMERASGRTLTKFFDQWFYTAGYPDIEVEFAFDAEGKAGTYTLTQKQINEDGEGPVFALEIELSWTIGGVASRQKVKFDAAKQYFRFAMESDPELVSVDPDGRVLHKQQFNPGDSKLRAQLTTGTLLERIRAARELGKTGKRANLEAIVAAYAAEPFWGARQQFASALAEAGTGYAVESLAQLIESEADPMVVGHVLQAAIPFRDEQIRSASLARLAKGNLGPWARFAAWRVVGAQHRDEDLAALCEAAEQPGIHDIARRGAIAGLAGIRSTAVVETLEGLLEAQGVEYRARSEAAMTLGSVAAFFEELPRTQARERLEDLIRNAEPTVAKAAAEGLARLGARQSVGMIQGLASRVSHQEAVALHRVIERVHTGKSEKVAALEKQVTDLRSDLRKLVERVEKIEPTNV